MTNKVSIIIASKYNTIHNTSRWYFDLHVQVYKSLHPCQYWECSKKRSGRFEVRLFWVIENLYWCVTSTVSKLQNWFLHQNVFDEKRVSRWRRLDGCTPSSGSLTATSWSRSPAPPGTAGPDTATGAAAAASGIEEVSVIPNVILFICICAKESSPLNKWLFDYYPPPCLPAIHTATSLVINNMKAVC